MPFELVWTQRAQDQYDRIKADAQRVDKGKKSSKQQGLFKQVLKCLRWLEENPRHPGLHSHDYYTLEHPYNPKGKVFESYIQNQTPGAYRVFWCYGKGKEQITLIAITPHP